MRRAWLFVGLLALTPLLSEPIARQDLRERCPLWTSEALLPYAPFDCAMRDLTEQTTRLQRALFRLLREIERELVNRQQYVP